VNQEQELDRRAREILSKLSLREKVSLLSGRDEWRTAEVPRVGLPSIAMTDGPHGVRTVDRAGRISAPATAFPTGGALAACWNPELVERVGRALGRETRALGCDILLGPCVNIVRNPLAGRNFESYSEDPFLAGRTAVAWILGVQREQVGASLKHFACNNQETERMRASSEVDERTFREIYLAAFETAVKLAQPWTVMCAYNRINGTYASENPYTLTQILRSEWGFRGMVVSDWGAVHSSFDPVCAGLDLEMPGPGKYMGQLLDEGVRNWQLSEGEIDQAALRVIRTVLRTGRADDPQNLGKGALDTPEHRALARDVACEAMVLLVNDGALLPIDPVSVKKIAVIGPNAADFRITGGGSASVDPPYRVSALEALTASFGASKVVHEQGTSNFVEPTVLKSDLVTPKGAEGRGFWAEYFRTKDFTGPTSKARVDRQINHWWYGPGVSDQVDVEEFSTRWTAVLAPKETGRHTIRLRHTGLGRVFLDDRLVLEDETKVGEALAAQSAFVELVAARPVTLRVEHVKSQGVPYAAAQLLFAFTPDETEDERIARAVAAAKSADVAIVVVGMPEGFETEGRDREDLSLPGRQNELVAAVALANPRTVVVVNAGAPVAMPWIDEVRAVVLAHYPGQEGGNALAALLTGVVSPSGKLAVTFPKRIEDVPGLLSAHGERETLYGEGIFVGYRHYERRKIEPLFPFGHGLSYALFEYGAVGCPVRAKAGAPVAVTVTVKNTGKVAAKEVVQLYVRDVKSRLPRPPKELKGFAKIQMAPGETARVELTLDERSFAFYDPAEMQWVVEPGEFEILVGSSSSDIRARAVIALDE
jgi:beta-glucosidase